jgi:hypothetical protein
MDVAAFKESANACTIYRTHHTEHMAQHRRKTYEKNK